MAARIRGRCMNPACPWVGRVREVGLNAVGLGQGLFGIDRVVCECSTEVEVEVVTVIEPAVTTVPTRDPSP